MGAKERQIGFTSGALALAWALGLGAASPAVAEMAINANRMQGQQFRQIGERINEALQAGDLAQAEDLARQRLGMVEGGPARQVGNAYRALGNILRQRGRNAEAEAMLRKAMPLLEEDNGRLSYQAIRGLFGLAATLLSQSRYAEADLILRDALARQLAYRPQHPDAVQAYNLLARTQINMARFDEADALLDKARAVTLSAEPAGPGDNTAGDYGSAYRRAQTVDLQGWLDSQRGRAAAAETHYREAVDAYRAILPDTHPDLVQARAMLGATVFQQGKAAEAEAILAPLMPVAEKVLGARHRETARAQYFLALAQARLGQPEAAEALFKRSLDSVRSSGQLGQLAQAARGYARFLLEQKRPAEALPLYREALDAIDLQFARTRGLDEATRENFIARYGIYYNETLELLLRLRKTAPAQGYDREALAVVSRTQSRLFTEMLREADVGKVSGDARFQQMKARLEAAKARVAELRRTRAEVGREDADGAPPTASDPFVAGRLAARRDRLKEDIAAQEQELAAAEGALWDAYPRYMELTQPRPVTVEALQKSLLKPGETLLTYYLLPRRVLIFLVERERFRLVEVPRPRQEVATLVAAARKPEEEAGGALGQLARLDPAVLNQLYQVAFQPVEPMLKPGQRLLVIGDGPLHTLPLEMLVSRWGAEEQQAFAAARTSGGPLLGEYATLPYLGQRYQFAYLPSLSSLASVRLYHKPAGGYDKELVSFADPVFERGGGYSGQTRRTLEVLSRSVGGGGSIRIPRLPETAEEAQEIAAILGGRSTVYLRDKAQEHTAKTLDLKGVRYLHFATHGLLGGEFVMLRDAMVSEGAAGGRRNLGVVAAPATPSAPAPDDGGAQADVVVEAPPSAVPSGERGQPALVLSLAGDLQGEDGLLTMSEVVESMDLNAQLVVLSACNTAGESADAGSGEGFAGLTRAFMYAGAKGLLVSHWSVESRSTQELMTELFRRSRGGADNLAALAAARDRVRGSTLDAGRPVSRAHPYFWAPFVYVGD